MRKPKQQKCSTLRILATIPAAWLLVIVVIAGAGWYYLDDWVPQSKLQRLDGATKADVCELFGEPNSGYSSEDKWEYQRHFRMAYFAVHFDEDGRVMSWNYDR